MIFYFKYFKKDFYLFVVTFILCLVLGLANGLLLTTVISAIWILRRSHKPQWTLRVYDPEYDSLKSLDS
jgi:MFS superfamily sulfate permease-like transporter